jgi:phosphohistidine phosphatase
LAARATLLVLRHAKAAREPAGADEDRPLTQRGRRDAAALGQWLAAQRLVPGQVVSSPARRTWETWQQLSQSLGAAAGQVRAGVDPRVYQASGPALLEIAREHAGAAGILLIAGHNPAAGELAAALTGRPGLAFPTCALAAIRLPGGWDTLAPGTGELAASWVPRPRP